MDILFVPHVLKYTDPYAPDGVPDPLEQAEYRSRLQRWRYEEKKYGRYRQAGRVIPDGSKRIKRD